MIDEKQLEGLLNQGQVGSAAWERSKQHILHQCSKGIVEAVNGLNATMKENAQASDSLGRKVAWLNAILAVATVIIAIGTVMMALKWPQ